MAYAHWTEARSLLRTEDPVELVHGRAARERPAVPMQQHCHVVSGSSATLSTILPTWCSCDVGPNAHLRLMPSMRAA